MFLISIKVEPAEVFDKISILGNKISNCPNPEKRSELIIQKEELEVQVNNAIGYEKAYLISKSKEYHNLYKANKDIFKAVDDSQTSGLVDPTELRNLNYVRYLCKKELNEKFFGSYSEIKIGYESK